MKKLRISALLLAILMVVSMLPVVALSVFAEGEEEATFPEKPATLPGFDIRKWDYNNPNDGTVNNAVGIPYTHRNATYTTQTLIDYTKLANDQVYTPTAGKAPIANANGLQIQKATTAYLRDGLDEEFAYIWRGGSGLMVAVDTTITGDTDIDAAGSGFHLEMTAEVKRASLDGSDPVVSEVVFSSSVNYRAHSGTTNPYETPSYYYSYYPEYEDFVCHTNYGSLKAGLDEVDADTWMCEILPNNNARIIDDYQGYFYLPFDYSFFCIGANGAGTYEGPGAYNTSKGPKGDIMTFNEAVEIYEDVKITNIAIYADWSNWSAAFREISVVFVEPEYAGGEDVEVEEIEGNVTITAPNTVATLAQNVSMIGADGLRFNIDTSAVNAPVKLRLSMISDIKKNESRWADGEILGGFELIPESELTMDAETGLPAIDPETGYPVDEDLFYFAEEVDSGEVDEDGKPIMNVTITYPYAKDDATKAPIFGKNTFVKLESDDYIKTISRGYDSLIYYFDAEGNPIPLTATDKTDIFAALPQGYVGEIYVPVGTFNASLTELLQVNIINAGVMNFTAIDFEYESEGTGNVLISDVAVCLTEAEVAGATVSVSDSLALNLYAYVDARYEVFSMEIRQNGRLVNTDVPGVAVEGAEDLYVFSVEGLTFDEMTDKFDVTLKLNGEKTAAQIKNYTVAKYVKHVLADENTDAATKTAFVDLLYYGDAVEKLMAKNEGAAVAELPTDVLSEDQKALRSASDAVLADAAADSMEGEENADFVWHSADIVFGGGLSIDFRAYLYDEIGYFAYIVDGEQFTVVGTTEWGLYDVDGLFRIRYTGFGVGDFANEMSVVFGYDEEATELPEDEGDLEGQTYTTSVNAILVLLAKSQVTTAEVKECAAALYNVGASFAALAAE